MDAGAVATQTNDPKTSEKDGSPTSNSVYYFSHYYVNKFRTNG